MKARLILLSGILIAAAVPAFAQATPDTQGTKMDQNRHGVQMNQAAQGTGVVEAVDRTKGTVRIKHQAIESIRWPAMTMTFKANPLSLLQSVKVGEKVNFTLHPAGMNSTVTAITPAQ